MKSISPLILALSFAVTGVACEEDIPEPSGNLNRPAGLVVVDRPEGVDLFIADSEAEGVRLQQFRPGTTDNSVVLDAFALAPVVFFPLVIPSPGFPTELVYSESNTLLHVLAPAYADDGTADRLVGAVHLLEAPDPGNTILPLRSSDAPGLIRRATVNLDALVGDGFVPLDLEIAGQEEGTDRVLIVFEALDATAGLAALVGINADNGVAQLLDSVALPPAPRQLLRVDETSFVVASAGSSTVAELQLDAAGTRITSVGAVDAGGPTRALVLVPTTTTATAGTVNALALRVDRPSVVLLERSNQGFKRSSRIFSSPHTPIEEREATQADPDRAGRIDLRSAVHAGAGTVTSVGLYDPDPERNDQQLAPSGVPLVFLGHVDGFATFLAGDPLELLVAEPARAARVTALTSDAVLDGFDPSGPNQASAANLSVSACAPPLNACNVNDELEDDEESPCDVTLVANDLPESATYRAEFFGLLHEAQNATLSVRGDDGPNRQVLALRDGNVGDFRELGVAPGDRVFVSLLLPESCLEDPELSLDRFEMGRVVEVQAAELRAVFEASVDDGRVLGSLLCTDEALSAARYQLLVGNGDAVLTRRSGESVLELVERVATATAGDRRRAQFSTRLSFTLEAPAGAGCSPEPHRCLNSVDCGAGRTCVGSSEGCFAACSEECVPGVTECVNSDRGLSCPGAEIEVGATRLGSLDLGSSLFRTSPGQADLNEVVVAVPSHTVYLPAYSNPVFVTSYPGSRTLIQLRLSEGLGDDGVSRGAYIVDVTR